MRNGTYVPPSYDPDVDAYITYNYSLGWEISDALKATFGIRNLLDTDQPFPLRYLDHGDGAAWESRVGGRTEERREGKKVVGTWTCRGAPELYKKKQGKNNKDTKKR